MKPYRVKCFFANEDPIKTPEFFINAENERDAEKQARGLYPNHDFAYLDFVETDELQLKIIWTEAYRPFIMGGDCYAPICTDVYVSSEIALGKGLKGHEATSPKGNTFIIESETGAIIGSSLTEVREDVANAEQEVLDRQIVQARKRVKQADPVDRDQFWKLMKEL